MVSLAFVISFVASAVALLIGIVIFSEVEDGLSNVLGGASIPESEELLGQNTESGIQLIVPENDGIATTNIASIYTGLNSNNFITKVSIPIAGVEEHDSGKGLFLHLPVDYAIGLYDSSNNLLGSQFGIVIVDSPQNIEVTFPSPVQVPPDGIVSVGIQCEDRQNVKHCHIEFLGDTTTSDFDNTTTIIIEPTLTINDEFDWFTITTTDTTSVDCDGVGTTKDKSHLGFVNELSTISGSCSGTVIEYPTTAIPDNARILKVEILIDVIAHGNCTNNFDTDDCLFGNHNHFGNRLSIGSFDSGISSSASTLWTEINTNSAEYYSDMLCSASGSGTPIFGLEGYTLLDFEAKDGLQIDLDNNNNFGITLASFRLNDNIDKGNIGVGKQRSLGDIDLGDSGGASGSPYLCELGDTPTLRVTYVTQSGLPDPFSNDGTVASSQRTIITELTLASVGGVNEQFAQASNIALTVLGVLPIALFFALFTILSPRVDGAE